MALIRLNNELLAFEKDSLSNMNAEPIDNDMFHWKGTLLGPCDTPFQGGVFFLDIKFPVDYPFKPPSIKFITKIFHPNVSSNGELCRSIYNDYRPLCTIDKFLLFIVSLLDTPNEGEPANLEATQYYREDRQKYNSIVREYTQKYAM